MTEYHDNMAYEPGVAHNTQDDELAKQLKRDRSFGILGLMSGDKALSKIGEALVSRADRYSRNATGKVHLGNGFLLDRARGTVNQDPQYAEFLGKQDQLKEERAARLQQQIMERMGYGAQLREREPRYTSQETEGGVAPIQINPNAAGGARAEPTIPVQRPISEGSAQLAAASERTANDLRQLQGDLARNPGAVSTPKEILKDVSGVVPGVGGTLRENVESHAYTPEQQRIRARAQAILNEYVKELSGAAVSQQEIERIKAAFPFAPGVTFDAAMARFPAFIDSVESKARAIRGAHVPREPAHVPSAATEQWVIGSDGKPQRVR